MIVTIPDTILYFFLGIIVATVITYIVGYYYTMRDLEYLDDVDWNLFEEVADEFDKKQNEKQKPEVDLTDEEIVKIVKEALKKEK